MRKLAAVIFMTLLGGCASGPISEEDKRWLSSPYDNRPPMRTPRTGRPFASPAAE